MVDCRTSVESGRMEVWQIPGLQEMAAFDVCLVTAMPAPPIQMTG